MRHRDGKIPTEHIVSIFTTFLVIIMTACTADRLKHDIGKKAIEETLKQAELLLEEHPDSVLNMLQAITAASLDSAQYAQYGLLLTAARFKGYLPVDTSLINRSINYYKRKIPQAGSYSMTMMAGKHAVEHLASSLYYKGVVLYDMGEMEQAALLLKQAESLAAHTGDELLMNKIYENLEGINDDADFLSKALEYNSKFVESSLRLNDSVCIIRAYDHRATLFNKQGKLDSVVAIYTMLSPLTKGRRDAGTAFVLANMADADIQQGRFEEARPLLLQAIGIAPQANQYIMLAKTWLHQGDTLRAIGALEKVITYDDLEFESKACRMLSGIYTNKGDNHKGMEYLQAADSLQKKSSRSKHAEMVMEAQYFIDEQRSTHKWIRRTLLIVGLASAMIAVSLGLLVRFRKKNMLAEKEKTQAITEMGKSIKRLEERGRASKEEITCQEKRIKDMNVTIAHLHEKEQEFIKAIEQRERNMDSLFNKLDRIQEERADRTAKGRQIYEAVISKNFHAPLSKEDEIGLADYCILFHPDKFQNAHKLYGQLTTRPMTYLILHEMGLTDNEIMTILRVSTNSIRQYRHKIRNTYLNGQE